nr:DUF551 domain-containing protein [Escherichia coli]
MSKIDYQALREAAEAIKVVATPQKLLAFRMKVTPQVVLALLDEREADKKRIAELEAKSVSQTYKLTFEQWLEQQHYKIDVDCGCVSTEMFMHWIRGAYEAGNYPVIPDGWISCSELMPEETGDIIVVSDGIVMSGISYSRRDGFYIAALEYDDDEPIGGVTHWMPLPEPPQEVT